MAPAWGLRPGRIIRVGNRVITYNTPFAERLEVLFPEGRTTPSRTFQTIVAVDIERDRPCIPPIMPLMLCCDGAAEAKVNGFRTRLPEGKRTRFSNAEALIATVFYAMALARRPAAHVVASQYRPACW